jgi:hypothetical protein
MQVLARSDAAVTGRLTRENIAQLSANSPRSIKGVMVRQPRECPVGGAPLAYYGFPISVHPLQHANIARHGRLSKDANWETHFGFKIQPVKFAFSDEEDTHFIAPLGDSPPLIAVSRKHQHLVNTSGMVEMASLMTEIEVPTAERFMHSNAYGYLLPRYAVFGEAWIILGAAGMNGKAFHYKLASDLLRAIAASIEDKDFFVFDFHTARRVMLPVENCFSREGFPACRASHLFPPVVEEAEGQ